MDDLQLEKAFTDYSLYQWAKKQAQERPDEEYRYSNHGDCFLAQYFKDMGFKGVHVGPLTVRIGLDFRPLPKNWNEIALGESGVDPTTYGQAFQRLKTLLGYA